jgi:hypothetical protein
MQYGTTRVTEHMFNAFVGQSAHKYFRATDSFCHGLDLTVWGAKQSVSRRLGLPRASAAGLVAQCHKFE